MSELKPCPFCGKKPAVSLNGYPRCPIPGVGTHAGGMRAEEWNTRPIEDELRQTIADLMADGERLAKYAADYQATIDDSDEHNFEFEVIQSDLEAHTALYKRLEGE